MVKEATGNRSMDRRIDEILMCEVDRAEAKERMRNADRIATIFCRAAEICAATLVALRFKQPSGKSQPIPMNLHPGRKS